jgi:trimeric autotransporter adhesin
LAAVASTFVVVPMAAADTIRANKFGDHPPNGCTSRDCTLREAVIKANQRGGRDTIVLQGGKTYRRSGAGTSEDAARDGDLDITGPLAIRSSGRRRATVDGNRNEQVFTPSAPTSFKRLRIIRGLNDFGPGSGGIDASARISVSNSLIARNTGVNGGGIRSADPVVVRRSKVTANVGLSHGGGLSLQGQSRIVESTIIYNRSNQGGGGLENFGGSLTVRGSTIKGNRTHGGAGGGGIDNVGTLRLTNTTISRNWTTQDGGGVLHQSGEASMNAVTVVRNDAAVDPSAVGGGGGLRIQAGSVTVRNSLIALNDTVATPGPDCFGAFTSAGHNLVGNTSGCLGFGGDGDLTDRVPSEIRVGRMANNGGPTQTAALRRGSAALNGAGSDAPARDQRGKRRRNPDIGAFERTRGD